MSQPIQLSNSQPQSRSWRRVPRRLAKALMKSHPLHLPKYNLPLRFRPWFVVLTCTIMVILAFLGFTNLKQSLPLNDKVLHFICFCIATGVFYFILDVEEDARRIWFWRHAGLIFTGTVCFFFGGLISEIVQSTLPYKEFEFEDVVANLLGAGLGLYIAFYLEKYYRHRREIARLYRPVNTDELSEDDASDEEDASGTQLLPLHQSRPSAPATKSSSAASKSRVAEAPRLGDVWDEREEIFGIADDSDLEDDDVEQGGGHSQALHAKP